MNGKCVDAMMLFLGNGGGGGGGVTPGQLEAALAVKADKTALARTDNLTRVIYKLLQGIVYETQTDSTAAYTKTVPSGAIAAEIGSIGGRSILYNQLVPNSSFGSVAGWSTSGGDLVSGDGGATYTYTSIGSYYYSNRVFRTLQRSIPAGHKILASVIFMPETAERTEIRMQAGGTIKDVIASLISSQINVGEWNHLIGISSYSDDINAVSIILRSSQTSHTENETVKLKNAVVIDLTAAFGAGSEPTAVDDERISALLAYYAQHKVQDSGTPLHAAVTGVVSKYKTVAWNQQIYNGNFAISESPHGWAASGSNTVEISNGEIRMTVTTPDAEFPTNGIVQSTSTSYPHPAIVSGHRYLVNFEYLNQRNKTLRVRTAKGNSYTGGFVKDFSVTAGEWLYGRFISDAASSDGMRIVFPTTNGGDTYEVGDVVKLRNVWMVDLTAMFGAGAEPTETTDERVAAIAAYVEENPLYNAGQTIGQTTVNDQIVLVTNPVLDLLEIPAAVRALEGYGQSEVGGNGNTLNLSAGTYTEIGHYVDGTWTPLEAPAVRDISAMLTGNMMSVEAGGTLTFAQDGTELQVPNRVDYLIKLSEVTE